jgi:hypothetical protein
MHFVYALISCWVWMFVCGEMIALIFKSWVVWLAVSSDYAETEREKGRLAGCAKQLLQVFPCCLPSEL